VASVVRRHYEYARIRPQVQREAVLNYYEAARRDQNVVQRLGRALAWSDENTFFFFYRIPNLRPPRGNESGPDRPVEQELGFDLTGPKDANARQNII